MSSTKFLAYWLLMIITTKYSQTRPYPDEFQSEKHSSADRYITAIQDFFDSSKYIADKLNDKDVEDGILYLTDAYYSKVYDTIKKQVDAAYGIDRPFGYSEERWKSIREYIETKQPKLREKLSQPLNKQKVIEAMHVEVQRLLKEFRENVVQFTQREKVRNVETFHMILEKQKINFEILRNEAERLAHIPSEAYAADSSAFLGNLVSNIEKEKEEFGRALQNLQGNLKPTYELEKEEFGRALQDLQGNLKSTYELVWGRFLTNSFMPHPQLILDYSPMAVIYRITSV